MSGPVFVSMLQRTSTLKHLTSLPPRRLLTLGSPSQILRSIGVSFYGQALSKQYCRSTELKVSVSGDGKKPFPATPVNISSTQHSNIRKSYIGSADDTTRSTTVTPMPSSSAAAVDRSCDKLSLLLTQLKKNKSDVHTNGIVNELIDLVALMLHLYTQLNRYLLYIPCTHHAQYISLCHTPFLFFNVQR